MSFRKDWPGSSRCSRRFGWIVAAVGLCATIVVGPAAAVAQQRDGPGAQAASPVVQTDDAALAQRQALPERFDTGLWPTLAAVVPGVLFHGTGLWAAGAPETAWNLARIQGVGMVVSTLGIIAAYGTGASHRTIEAIYYPSLVGLTAFVMPWFADIYGSSVGGRDAGPRLTLPLVEARTGYAYIRDPIFDFTSFSYTEAELRIEPIRVRPSAWLAVDDDNQRLRLEVIGRLFGPRASARPARSDGSFLDLETAFTYHNFGSDDFQTIVLEAQLAGRYDMRRFSPVLRGSFFELALGVGGQLFGYDVEGGAIGEDVDGLLLMRTAYGVYFGPSGDRYGEAELYYNHRHDDFAAGLALGTNTDGLFGHVGAKGFYYLSDHWGAFADFRAGSAYVAMGGVAFRYGGK